MGYIIGFSDEVPTRRRILLPIYLTHKRTDEFDFILALWLTYYRTVPWASYFCGWGPIGVLEVY